MKCLEMIASEVCILSIYPEYASFHLTARISCLSALLTRYTLHRTSALKQSATASARVSPTSTPRAIRAQDITAETSSSTRTSACARREHSKRSIWTPRNGASTCSRSPALQRTSPSIWLSCIRTTDSWASTSRTADSIARAQFSCTHVAAQLDPRLHDEG